MGCAIGSPGLPGKAEFKAASQSKLQTLPAQKPPQGHRARPGHLQSRQGLTNAEAPRVPRLTFHGFLRISAERAVGCDGSRNLLTVKDLATGLKSAYPMAAKSAEHTIAALSRFCGSYLIGCVYSDGAPELDEACRRLGYPHDKSHSGVPQNSGIIERCN